jgi:hypothetical protein
MHPEIAQPPLTHFGLRADSADGLGGGLALLSLLGGSTGLRPADCGSSRPITADEAGRAGTSSRLGVRSSTLSDPRLSADPINDPAADPDPDICLPGPFLGDLGVMTSGAVGPERSVVVSTKAGVSAM